MTRLTEAVEPVVPPEVEARRLFRYVLGAEPGAYPVAKYIGARERLEEELRPEDPFDAWLLEIASRRGGTLVVDAYTRFFRSASSFRRRLAVSVAILECSPGAHEAFERPPPGGRSGLVFQLAWRGARFLLAALVGACALPLGWLLLARSEGRSPSRSRPTRDRPDRSEVACG